MPLKSVRPFDFFWYGDNSKVNNNRARGIYDRVQAPASAMRERSDQSAEAGPLMVLYRNLVLGFVSTMRRM